MSGNGARMREGWSVETRQRLRALRTALRPWCRWSDRVLHDESAVTALEIGIEWRRALRRAEKEKT